MPAKRQMAERLFQAVLDHLRRLSSEFIRGKARGRTHRFKVPIHIFVTTMPEAVVLPHAETVQ